MEPSVKKVRLSGGRTVYADYSGPAPRISMVLTPLSDENLRMAAQIGVTDVVRYFEPPYPARPQPSDKHSAPAPQVYYDMDTCPDTAGDLIAIRKRVEAFGLRLGNPPQASKHAAAAVLPNTPNVLHCHGAQRAEPSLRIRRYPAAARPRHSVLRGRAAHGSDHPREAWARCTDRAIQEMHRGDGSSGHPCALLQLHVESRAAHPQAVLLQKRRPSLATTRRRPVSPLALVPVTKVLVDGR